jgi:hypothetical protein
MEWMKWNKMEFIPSNFSFFLSSQFRVYVMEWDFTIKSFCFFIVFIVNFLFFLNALIISHFFRSLYVTYAFLFCMCMHYYFSLVLYTCFLLDICVSSFPSNFKTIEWNLCIILPFHFVSLYSIMLYTVSICSYNKLSKYS